MFIRAARPADQEPLREVLTQAFADDGRVADLARALDARVDCPTPALVAEIDEHPVGCVALSRGWVDAASRLVDVLILSPLGVAPAHQRRGIGRALSAAAVQRARELGAPAVFLEGDPAYYVRLGWEPASAYGVTPPSARIPAPGCQMIALPSWERWMTGALVYNDTFWAFDCVGLRDAASAGADGMQGAAQLGEDVG